jgi:hypothetical protein
MAPKFWDEEMLIVRLGGEAELYSAIGGFRGSVYTDHLRKAASTGPLIGSVMAAAIALWGC